MTIQKSSTESKKDGEKSGPHHKIRV